MTSDISKIARQRRKRNSRPDMVKRRLMLLLFLVVAVMLAFEFAHLGYICYFEQDKQMRTEQQNGKMLRAKADELRKETKKLRTLEGKKELARSAGLVGKGEVPIIISGPGEKKTSKQAPDGR